jgi:hypothetical protein
MEMTGLTEKSVWVREGERTTLQYGVILGLWWLYHAHERKDTLGIYVRGEMQNLDQEKMFHKIINERDWESLGQGKLIVWKC